MPGGPLNDSTYHFLRFLLDANLWGGELLNADHLPSSGPAVFVSNHLGALGPIGVISSIPIRLYPWIIADMVDSRLAPDYLRVDFVERELGLRPPWSMVLARLIAAISTPLLRSVGCVPVYREAQNLQTTFAMSLSLLQQGKCLLIFPEDPRLPADPLTRIAPFKKGFARLGERYYRQSGTRLPFYPLAVHESRRVMVGQPVTYDPLNPRADERLRIKHLMEHSIREMYLALSGGGPSPDFGLTRPVEVEG